MTVTAIIGLGANLENPIEQVQQAISELATVKGIKLLKASSLYATLPVGPQDQPNFINAVAQIETVFEAHQLLDELQALEQKHRRVRLRHWGPRTLDLDLLFFGQETISTQRLTVPHPEIINRAFVIIPLLEILPDFRMPNGEALSKYVNGLPAEDMKAIHII